MNIMCFNCLFQKKYFSSKSLKHINIMRGLLKIGEI